MDTANHQQVEREAQRIQAYREELVERIARAIPEDGTAEPLSGLHLGRVSKPLEEVHGVMEPSFCVIAQGAKRSFWATAATGTTPSITFSPPSSCPASAGSWKRRKIG